MPRSVYRHGRIIWGYLRSNQTGKRQKHPAIILDRDSDIIQPEQFDPRSTGIDNVVHVIGVSTKYNRYNLPYVRLPFAATGHAVTGLKQDCAAIVGWYHRIVIPDDVIGFAGDVPSPEMRRINEAVRRDLAERLGSAFNALRDMFGELLGGGE